jgi:D-isomer specific 2-hydroxyacid dehydrogenase, catalytic domain
MTTIHPALNVAALDDHKGVALEVADWAAVREPANPTVFNDHLADTDAVVKRVLPFGAICIMRERTPMSRAALERLPRLKLIASTGFMNASIDRRYAAERGIAVRHTGCTSNPTIELTVNRLIPYACRPWASPPWTAFSCERTARATSFSSEAWQSSCP